MLQYRFAAPKPLKNRAGVGLLRKGSFVQPYLAVGAPGDPKARQHLALEGGLIMMQIICPGKQPSASPSD